MSPISKCIKDTICTLDSVRKRDFCTYVIIVSFNSVIVY